MTQPTATAHLTLATPAEQAARWQIHFAAWGIGFDHGLFLRREAALAETPYGHHQVRQWLWRADDGRVLASCETYGSAAWYVDPVGWLSREPLQSVASVLVAPELRNQGYAAAMMPALVRQLRAEGTTLSTLYSDVGPNLYRRSGYMLHQSRESFVTVAGAPTWLDATDRLDLSDLADVLAQQDDLASAWLGASAAPAVVEVAAVDRVAWFATRSRYRAWARGQSPNAVVGASCGNDGVCLWTADSAEPVLHVLLWRPRDGSGADRLTQAALAHAATLGLAQVVWWDADRDTGLDPYRRPPLQPSGITSRDRSTGLPMLAWLTPGRQMPMVWQGIERLGWC